jgi:hypothetical protein
MYFGGGAEEQPMRTNAGPPLNPNTYEKSPFDRDNFDTLYIKFKEMTEYGMTFESKYEVRKDEGMISRFCTP